MSIVSRIQEHMLNDDEDDSPRLLRAYENGTDTVRAAMDDMCICLCGWSLETIIREAKHDEDGDEDQEEGNDIPSRT